jgi:hypothetical protein
MMGPISWIRIPVDARRSEGSVDFYDPNGGLDKEVRDRGARLSLLPFENARVNPERVAWNGVNQFGFVFGQAGGIGHLVYVRVTVGDEQETGTGPVPGILIDLARELKAEPHVVRVHLRSEGEGTAVEYFGHDELERALKEGGDYWRRRLLGARTAREYLRLAGGRISRLEVRVVHQPPGEWPKREFGVSAEEKLLREIFGESAEGEEERNDFPGSVSLGLSVDTLPPEMLRYTISLSGLVASASESDEHFIFSCSCGCPQCSGIWRGVEVVDEDGLVVWRIRGISPRRVVVFERAQYRREVLTKVREALSVHKGMGPKAWLGASDRAEWVEAALYRAGEEGSA